MTRDQKIDAMAEAIAAHFAEFDTATTSVTTPGLILAARHAVGVNDLAITVDEADDFEGFDGEFAPDFRGMAEWIADRTPGV